MASAMRKVSMRNLAAHKVRLLLTTISVLLGTAFVAGSFVFTDTLNSTFTKIFDSADKGIDARVQPHKNDAVGVPLDFLNRIEAVPGVKKVQPVATQPVVLVNKAGHRVNPGGAPSEGGIWVPPAESVTPVRTFASGSAPTHAGQVAINQGAARKGHIATGDVVKVVLPNAGVVNVTVSGVYKTLAAETGGYVGVLFTEQQALQLLTDGQHLSAVDIAADAGVSQKELTARVDRVLPKGLEAITGDQVRKDDQKGIQTALSFINIILLAFGFVALIVGTFIIYNTFSMIVAQRLRELALLRAVGADRKQVRRSVLLEAGVIGAIGSVAGVAGGVGLAYGLHALLDALDLGLPSGGLVLSTRTIVIALAAGIGVTLLSASAPARRAGRIPPVAAMREEFSTPSAVSLRRRSIIGVVFAALGVLGTVAGVSSGGGSGASLLGLGLFGVAVGAMLLSPTLARWIITPLGRLVGRPFGSVGQLARTNAVRNPRRTAATSFALTLGLLLVSGIAVIGASFKGSINHLFDTNVKADYMLLTQVDLDVPLKAVNDAAKVDGVKSMTQLHDLPARIDGTSRKHGTAVDGPLTPVVRVDVIRGASEPAPHTILLSKTVADDNHWTVGGTHTMTSANGQRVPVKVTGIYKDNQLLGPWLVTGDAYRTLVPSNDWGDMVALVKLAPGANAKAVRTSIERITDPYYVIDVQTNEEFKGTLASQVNGLLGLLYGLLGLAIVIAILGIINTLALSVVERRHEIGMLRAVGMQRAQVRRTIYLESFLIAVFGAALGLALGVTYGSLFARTLKSQGLDVVSVPWGQAVTFLVVAGVVGVLAALWPGIRAARTRPLEAIASA
ncbi:MAG TPA: FtsX-like permease family protein [Jatrophihabitantaceae bacterium]|nr:FtsX-like permease family protein [Jatrophihabitantaceae bacterium]